MTANKQDQLNELNKKMLACSQCVLRSSCTQVVPGEGSEEAEIMFIGEGPGKKEDELGQPFVGAAGKFLDELLNTIGLKRESVYPHTKMTLNKNDDGKNTPDQKKDNFGVGVYIANVVKCRPPMNRDPLPEEVEACWPWLMKQIKTIQPKLIVTLGRHSMERFLPNQKISQIHGKAMRRNIPEIGTYVFYALYHPAAALYNGSMREVLISDFKKIPKVLEATKKSEANSSQDIIANETPQIEPEENKQESLF
jgi:DNA polymerase